jgi:hypothetical protein
MASNKETIAPEHTAVRVARGVHSMFKSIPGHTCFRTSWV